MNDHLRWPLSSPCVSLAFGGLPSLDPALCPLHSPDEHGLPGCSRVMQAPGPRTSSTSSRCQHFSVGLRTTLSKDHVLVYTTAFASRQPTPTPPLHCNLPDEPLRFGPAVSPCHAQDLISETVFQENLMILKLHIATHVSFMRCTLRVCVCVCVRAH